MQQLNKKIKVVSVLLFVNTLVFSQSSRIFIGGNGDGWTSQNYVQPRASIFKGGNGDGWNSGYRPMGPLSGALAKFTAQKLGNNSALVTWKTLAGMSSHSFEVERSNDAVNFSFIGKEISGNLPAVNDHTFTDDQPLKGPNYYRLKQRDPDGKVTYSPARLVQFDSEVSGSIKFYPNPTNGILHIAITKEMQQEPMLINISNVSGIVVDQVKRPLSSTTAIFTIDMKQYERGIYFIQVKTNTTNTTQRVVLQ